MVYNVLGVQEGLGAEFDADGDTDINTNDISHAWNYNFYEFLRINGQSNIAATGTYKTPFSFTHDARIGGSSQSEVERWVNIWDAQTALGWTCVAKWGMGGQVHGLGDVHQSLYIYVYETSSNFDDILNLKLECPSGGPLSVNSPIPNPQCSNNGPVTVNSAPSADPQNPASLPQTPDQQPNGAPSSYTDPKYSQPAGYNPAAIAQQAQDPNNAAHPQNPKHHEWAKGMMARFGQAAVFGAGATFGGDMVNDALHAI
ncbi:hypothetical protein MMC12_002894 [Toensbergia leucococca]|nr:hypothetical protein [Toensbergia leucococca]